MTKLLYITGDSFSFGEELDQERTFTEYKKQNCYARYICDQFDIPDYINSSMPAGSNERSYRHIITDVSRLLEQYKPDDLFVTVSLSHCNRREFYRADNKQYYAFMANQSPPNFPILKGFGDYKLWNVLTQYYYEDYGYFMHDCLMVLGIQNFLKTTRVPYLLTMSMMDAKENQLLIDNIPPEIRNQFDSTRYLIQPSFLQYTLDKGYQVGKNFHPLEDAHREWGLFLSRIIRINNLL